MTGLTQVADDVYALGTRGHNYYLLRDGNEVTMVDAGCSKEWGKLVSALEHLGLTTDAVSGVLATHAHGDHFGMAKRATDEGIDVRVHEDEETRALGTYTGRFSASASDVPMFRIHSLRTFLPMVRAGLMSLDHPEVVGTFADGDTLDLPGRLTAVHTPGHTEGHTMFHAPHLGLLFSGDGLITMDLLSTASGPQLIGDVFNLDPAQALRSLDRIDDLDASLLLPGHGQPWSGTPRDAAEIARAVQAAA